MCMERQERRERKILTENRLATVNKRETSFEGLVSQLESGEDGIYNLIHENKNQIFKPKVKITKKDLEEIPELQQIRNSIEFWEEKAKTAQGREAFIIRKTIIELRKDQYLVKDSFRQPIQASSTAHSRGIYKLTYDDNTCNFDEEGYPIPSGLSLLDPNICSTILCLYSKLKQDGYSEFIGDLYYLMEDFDKISTIALAPYPIYQKLVLYKIDGRQNAEIQNLLQTEFGITHSLEYLSSLWRNKIPKLIASAAEDQYLDWYYLNIEKGKYKRCSCCGQIKLAHNKYFSKNKTSKDGYYSICKKCRNAKSKKKKRKEK